MRAVTGLCALACLGTCLGTFLGACQPALQSNKAPPASPQSEIGLTVFAGGTIYTGKGLETVEAVMVDRDGLIVSTSSPVSQDWAGRDVTQIDLDGAFMYPGFVDGHVHLLGVGQRELTPNQF